MPLNMSRSDWIGVAIATLIAAAGFFFGGPLWGCSFLFIGVVAVVRVAYMKEELSEGSDLSLYRKTN